MIDLHADVLNSVAKSYHISKSMSEVHKASDVNYYSLRGTHSKPVLGSNHHHQIHAGDKAGRGGSFHRIGSASNNAAVKVVGRSRHVSESMAYQGAVSPQFVPKPILKQAEQGVLVHNNSSFDTGLGFLVKFWRDFFNFLDLVINLDA